MKTAKFLGALAPAYLCLFLIPAAAKTLVQIDLDAQTMQVDHDGQTYVWPVSTGKAGYETPEGDYRVTWTDPDHKSDEYQGARLPWTPLCLSSSNSCGVDLSATLSDEGEDFSRDVAL